ncbi:MAG TPA: ACP S-malonyltransferase [candidate division WOR-3 bacterium]|uniref:Malonyl CoA-acyl carrier protein transacylase n=1 Tax=candidate division WOR-3 bacterium TaxID=2052148 RepID=A0A9C9EN52_UNCW3|nr:ACP S-malonyltransferase [candidate division WOR-3 bacterium]
MKKAVFLFDGQGAFRPGIGKELCAKYHEADEIIEKCSEILEYNIKDWLWGEEAKETSSKTSIAQPAISAVSLAYAAVLKNLGVTSEISLGHSLGEITAVLHCRIVSFEDGMKIIKKRGELMEKGGGQGTMMAVIKVDQKTLEKICADVSAEIGEPVVVANINAPNQIVISGSKEGIKKAAQNIVKQHGRGIPLRVGGAWHSPYLKDAANEFAGFLDTIQFNKPESPFYSVVEQKTLDDPAVIKDSLKKQMLSQVNWVTAIKNLNQAGHKLFLEIGPSKILKDLVGKIEPAAKVDSTALYTDMETLAANL